mgnify:CR=1 FL=1
MKVNEYGSEHEKTVAMFQCAAEPGWVFIPSAEALAKDYHVFLFIADGHDELGTTFVSIEKYVDDAASYLKENGIWDDYVLDIVGGHHEMLDGSGYPGRSEFQTLHVHIVTIADIYEALTSTRSYKNAFSHQEARLILDRDASDGKLSQVIVNQLTPDIFLSENSRKIVTQTVDEYLLKRYYERHDKNRLIQSLLTA